MLSLMRDTIMMPEETIYQAKSAARTSLHYLAHRGPNTIPQVSSLLEGMQNLFHSILLAHRKCVPRCALQEATIS